MTKVLIVGGTGQLGRLSVQGLRAAGLGVRCLVRPGRDDQLTRNFLAIGAELVEGDLKDPLSLQAACRSVDVVVNMASATLSQSPGDTIESVDRLGNLALVDAAASSKVPRFVFVSFADIPFEFALKSAKVAVCDRLRGISSMTHTVLQPGYFMESWLPTVAPSQPEQPAVFFGSGDGKSTWIAREDVAHAVVAAAQRTSQESVSVPLGGPDTVSPRQVFETFQARGARKASEYVVDDEALKTELAQAHANGNAVAEAFAVLKMGVARGLPVPGGPLATSLLPARPTTVADFVTYYLETTPSARA